ncbi:MAG: GNAT family N-acetyltransferase [candidate division Zixibacteria bacterium]|nr:GNAT family N-acetyltransferase [candidate division Zixibacteria bacterium]
MQVRLIDKFEDFLKLEDKWNHLVEKSQSDSPFLTFEWLVCWWKSYSSSRSLFVLLVKENEEIVALVPLMIEKVLFRGLPIRKLCFMVDGNSLLVDFILANKKEEVVKNTLDFIFQRKAQWDLLAFENLSVNCDTFKILVDLLKDGSYLYGITSGSPSPYIDINSDWGSFFTGRPKKFREVIRNKQNRLKKMGEVGFERYEKLTPELLPILFDIGAKSWKNKKKRAISSTKEKRDFFECLSQKASQNGWLLIWLLRLNQKPIAYEYHLKYKDEVWGLRSEYDEAYREAGPGTVLDRYIVEQIFKDGFKRYHLGWGADFYKLRWTENIRKHRTILIFPHNLYGRILHTLEFRLIGKIKQFLLSKGKIHA